MTPPTIVFDLDGTLIDTAPDLLASLNHCLNTIGMEEVDPSRLRRFVGRGARVMIERAFQDANRDLPKPQLEELFAVFLDHYGSNIPGESHPFDGARDAISRFEAAGYALAICTNKYERLAADLVAALDMKKHFATITGADTFAFRKPDPRHLTETIRLAGGHPEQAILIGDSATDIDTAKAAQIPVVAVDFGYTEAHVSTFGPSRVISHFDELTVAVAEQLISVANSDKPGI